MKNAIFRDVRPYGSFKNLRFGGPSVLTGATRHSSSEFVFQVMEQKEIVQFEGKFQNCAEGFSTKLTEIDIKDQ
jgi:hypothetical protein